ncbi:helix-turn-helix domain-containing protein [Flavobacterium hibisci]|uniref:helix-turn-helix domain-containing protein n=1 Tax=Flavobacterium hibisci TaxID=1914462 RepID=UPI001CC06E34|nr:helix-turn-helix transcriptional regulator [Flavobacterium hibisci]MBZ4040745.1 helix-turn-helix domain-containing protein [Flavobacterium hibisci]
MLNIDGFVKRLETVLDYYSLNASAFADKIGVQRSSMSHLLSGRNKPSLDFIMKILEVFPQIDLYWILTGKGNFPKNNNEVSATFTQSSESVSSNKDSLSEIEINSKEKKETGSFLEIQNLNLNFEDKEIEKIVLFYKNGTFKTYSAN